MLQDENSKLYHYLHEWEEKVNLESTGKIEAEARLAELQESYSKVRRQLGEYKREIELLRSSVVKYQAGLEEAFPTLLALRNIAPSSMKDGQEFINKDRAYNKVM